MDTDKPPRDLLSYTNYHKWSNSWETFLQTKNLNRHIIYEDFDQYYETEYELSVREIRFFRDLQNIKDSKKTQKEKEDEIIELEENVNDSSKWISQKTKEKRLWIKEENQVKGYIRGGVP